MVSSNDKKKSAPASSGQGSQDQKRHEENIHHNFNAKIEQERRVLADKETPGRLHNDEYDDTIDDLEESYGPPDDEDEDEDDGDEDFGNSKKRSLDK